MASRIAFYTTLASLPLMLSACIVTCTGSDGDDDPATTTTTTTSAAGGSGGGTATVGGAGGSGGELVGGGGSGGGEPDCVGEDGTGQSVDTCGEMNITPPSAGGGSMLCGPDYDEDPVGYLVCLRAFELYTPGQAEDLQACLAEIGAEDACEEQPVVDCLYGMYEAACEREEIVELCEGFAQACDPDPFDAELCAAELNPFSDGGLEELVDCINDADPGLNCQEAYDACFEDVVTRA